MTDYLERILLARVYDVAHETPLDEASNLSRRLGKGMPAWSGDHNPGLPTSKTWVRKHYGVVAMTYEVGDNTPRERIRGVAVAAAEEMMKLMLEMGLPET